MLNSKRCAACKYLRRRCPQDCVLAPYFPPNNPQRFACVHKIFGASNVTRMLQQLPVHMRAEAADCMSMEARCRVENPVYGCVGEIDQLQQDIKKVEGELAKTRAEIAFYSNQQQQAQQQAQQQVRMDVAHVQQSDEGSSLLNGSGFQLDQQVVLPDFYFQQFDDQM